MPSLRIWAPNASRVDIRLDDRTITAARDGAGWWRGPDLTTGARYAIAVDGGPSRPDPRSPWQPDGVHGASCWIDASELAAGARGQAAAAAPVPLRDALIYELHVGTFTEGGTFEAAVAHLDDLVALGVTHVELMPVAQFPGAHGWGYDGVDLFAPHAAYGGPRGLAELVRQCKQRGLAVLIDSVLNHFGPEGAYVSELGPYRTARHQTPWGDAVNLDGPGSEEVRRFLIDSALTWLADYGADGLRLDAVHALHDDSERHFVAELVDEVRALEQRLGRPLVLIGEYDLHDPVAVRERARGGWGLDAHWNDDFHHAIHALVTGEHGSYYTDFAEADTLVRVLEHGYALDGRVSRFRGGPHGQPFGALQRDRLVAYIQSHDQIGNRAAGERLHHLAGTQRTMAAAAILMVSPFVPMLFQGEEWAASAPFHYFAQMESPELRAAIREGRRAEHAMTGEVGLDPDDPATRERSVLPWHERSEPAHAAMLDWYRALIAARRTHPELRDPSPESTQATRRRGLLEIRRGGLRLVCNLTEQAEPAELGDIVLASVPLANQRELPPLACALVRG
ncbi:MAG TPA: malto-oligosyltrehalose trehalohydrolase [Kofleriaceae bacterium]|nr:malto-oligosyltrehalose trehalohydrolase [Kofleriaceae bacterium]